MAHHGHTIPETRQDNCWWISLQRRAIGSCHTNCHGQRLHGLNLRWVRSAKPKQCGALRLREVQCACCVANFCEFRLKNVEVEDDLTVPSKMCQLH